MKSLLLVRHAEARAARPGTVDQERLLSRHGHSQARTLGRWFKRRRITPDRIVSSAIVRAQQTTADIVGAAGWNLTAHADASLYSATARHLLALVRSQPEVADQLLIVAHAPGVAELAGLLAAHHGVAIACEPATLIEVRCACDRWTDIGPGSGVLTLILPP